MLKVWPDGCSAVGVITGSLVDTTEVAAQLLSHCSGTTGKELGEKLGNEKDLHSGLTQQVQLCFVFSVSAKNMYPSIGTFLLSSRASGILKMR